MHGSRYLPWRITLPLSLSLFGKGYPFSPHVRPFARDFFVSLRSGVADGGLWTIWTYLRLQHPTIPTITTPREVFGPTGSMGTIFVNHISHTGRTVSSRRCGRVKQRRRTIIKNALTKPFFKVYTTPFSISVGFWLHPLAGWRAHQADKEIHCSLWLKAERHQQ